MAEARGGRNGGRSARARWAGGGGGRGGGGDGGWGEGAGDVNRHYRFKIEERWLQNRAQRAHTSNLLLVFSIVVCIHYQYLETLLQRKPLF